MMNTDPRVTLAALNDDLAHQSKTTLWTKEDAAAMREMLLMRAVLMVACELRELRELMAAKR